MLTLPVEPPVESVVLERRLTGKSRSAAGRRRAIERCLAQPEWDVEPGPRPVDFDVDAHREIGAVSMNSAVDFDFGDVKRRSGRLSRRNDLPHGNGRRRWA